MKYKKAFLYLLLFGGLALSIPICNAKAAEVNHSANLSETRALKNPISGEPAVQTAGPSAEKIEVAISDPDFSEKKLDNDTQMYKGEFVTTEDGKSAAKIGEAEPAGGSDLEKAFWKVNTGKGMVNKVIHVEPSTKYQVSVDINASKGTAGECGLLILEAGETKGKTGSAITAYKGSGKRQTYTNEIITGPRTSEIYAFVYIKDPGVALVTNFKAEKIPADSEETIVEQTVTADQQVTEKTDFPVTVPSVQSFDKTKGTGFTINQDEEIIYADEVSHTKAEYLAAELREAGIVSKVTVQKLDEKTAAANAIVMKVGETGLAYANPEKPIFDSYTVNISNGSIVITGDQVNGVQAGAMTLLQALKQRSDLPNGIVKDYTNQQYRGLQVDTGRHYWSIDWLKNEIEHLAYLKQNFVQLRMKDNEGIRYDSKAAPEFVDRKGGFYTEAQIKDLVAYGKKFSITIIPEIDFPGHSQLEAAVRTDYRIDGCPCLDFTKQEVRDYMYSIYKEAADLFETPIVHIGGDEYFQDPNLTYDAEDYLTAWAQKHTGDENAMCYDTFKICMNEMADKLIKDGYQVMMWSDNIVSINGPVPLDRRIIVDIWSPGIYASALPFDYMDAGFKLFGSPGVLYHDTWPQETKIETPLPDYVWDEWNQSTYISGEEYNNTLGEVLPIWDDPHGFASDYIVTQSLFPRFAAFAQKEWASPMPYKDYSKFETMVYYLGSTNAYVNNVAAITYNQKDVDVLLKQAEEKAAADGAKTQLKEIKADFEKNKQPTGKDYTDFVHQLMFFNENGFVIDNTTAIESDRPLKLDVSGIQIVKNGKTLNLLSDKGMSKAIHWTFSKDGIVKVDENGVLTAVKPGMVKVTAACGDQAAAITVRVTQ